MNRKPGRPATQKTEMLQRMAAHMLATGINATETARRVGVSRQTVYKWQQSDNFCQLLAEAKDLALTANAQHLTDAIPLAWDCVMQAIREGDARVAHQLLRDSGALATAGLEAGMISKDTGGQQGIQIVVNLGQDEPPTIDTGAVVSDPTS